MADREWASFNKSERHVFYGTTRSRASGCRVGSFGFALAVFAAFTLVIAGQLPRKHPLIPALGLGLSIGGTSR